MPPSNEDIEAVINKAMASSPAKDIVPGRDTRTQLYVGNLPYRVRWQDLKDLFRKAGTVLRSDVALGPDNRSRGYGTVLLATAEDAGRAIDMFHGFSWQGRILEVRQDRLPTDLDALSANSITSRMASPVPHMDPFTVSLKEQDLDQSLKYSHVDPGDSSGKNLFVGNLPFHCQWQDLKDLFRKAGTILRADVALGHDGRSRGFGTVVFASDADSERAVAMFNGYEYNGRVLKVHLDKFSQASLSHPPLQIQHPLPPQYVQHLSSSYLPASAFASPMDHPAFARSFPPKPERNSSSESRTSSSSSPTSSSSPNTAMKRPGKIALPPPPAGIYPYGLPSPIHHPMSPGYVIMTPHGLPPMTPSMPPFSFLPSPLHHPALAGGPISPPLHPLHAHHKIHSQHQITTKQQQQAHQQILAGALSPGALYGPGSIPGNPYINAAPGAPVHSGSFIALPPAHLSPQPHVAINIEPSGYFDIPTSMIPAVVPEPKDDGSSSPPSTSNSRQQSPPSVQSSQRPITPPSDAHDPSGSDSVDVFYDDDAESPPASDLLRPGMSTNVRAKSIGGGNREEGENKERFVAKSKDLATALRSMSMSAHVG